MPPSPLSFTFIANACGIFTGRDGSRILCDPWLKDGVFDGSWCHYPPLKTSMEDIRDVDAVFISHLHPDHFDERTFDFAYDTPLIVLEHPPNFLIRKLESLGYTNLIRIKDGETATFREFELTCYAPFEGHVFHEADVGNLIDSALIVACDGVSALNANDNTPSLDAARMLFERFGAFDLAMLNYNAAGPYPSCFDNLSIDDKREEHSRVLTRNLDHLVGLLHILKPRAFLPFAGAYVIGGREHHKNAVLGTTTWDACADYVRPRCPDVHTVTLREGDTYDLTTKRSDKPYEPVDTAAMQRYIADTLAHMPYPYEADAQPDEDSVLTLLETAADAMKARMGRMNLKSDFSVILNVGDTAVSVYPDYAQLNGKRPEKRLECTLDLRLLKRILERKSHWNNAEIGAHINFVRTPNTYQPDLHTALQFLHV
ncbi:MAG: MBL fold metallo-hydrolase [Pseudomonadota bacterium]